MSSMYWHRAGKGFRSGNRIEKSHPKVALNVMLSPCRQTFRSIVRSEQLDIKMLTQRVRSASKAWSWPPYIGTFPIAYELSGAALRRTET